MDKDTQRIKSMLVENIKKYRGKLGLTQEQAAEKAGISTNYWQRLEMKSQPDFPSFTALDRIASALKIKMSHLLEE